MQQRRGLNFASLGEPAKRAQPPRAVDRAVSVLPTLLEVCKAATPAALTENMRRCAASPLLLVVEDAAITAQRRLGEFNTYAITMLHARIASLDAALLQLAAFSCAERPFLLDRVAPFVCVAVEVEHRFFAQCIFIIREQELEFVGHFYTPTAAAGYTWLEDGGAAADRSPSTRPTSM